MHRIKMYKYLLNEKRRMNENEWMRRMKVSDYEDKEKNWPVRLKWSWRTSLLSWNMMGGKKSYLVSEVIAKKTVAASPQKKRRRVQRDLSMGWGQHADDCKRKQKAVWYTVKNRQETHSSLKKSSRLASDSGVFLNWWSVTRANPKNRSAVLRRRTVVLKFSNEILVIVSCRLLRADSGIDRQRTLI